MESINKSQLYAVLVSVRLFEYVCSTDMYCRNQTLGILISIGFQAITMLLVTMFRSKARMVDMVLSNRGISWMYVLYCTFYGGVSIGRLTSVDNVVPKTLTGIVCIVLFGVTCVYCSKLGFKALFRSSIVVTFLVVVSFVIVVYGAVPSMDISNAYHYNDSSNVWHYAISDFAKSTDVVFLVLLMEASYSKVEAFKYLGYKLLALEVLSLVGLCILGGISVSSKFSFIELASYSQPFGIQRSNAMYSLVTTLMGVLNVSLGLTLSSKLLGKTLGRYKESVLMLSMVVVSYAVGSLDVNVISSVLVLLMGCLVPTVLNFSNDSSTIEEGV